MYPKIIKMLILDFDGTSAVYGKSVRVHSQILQTLEALRDTGMSWMMASDRSSSDLADITSQLDPQRKPIALLTQQKYVHFIDRYGEYRPHSEWNEKVAAVHQELWEDLSPRFRSWTSIVESHLEPLVSIHNDESYGFVVAESDVGDLDRVLTGLVKEFPSAQITGNHNSRSVSHRSFSKAQLVQEACRVLSIKPQHIFTIGDGINDLSMMRELVCGGVGCPSDACREIRDQVLLRGGIIGRLKGPEGTADILEQLIDNGSSEGAST